MIDLIADTETTGLWKFKEKFESVNQPGIAQLAFKLVEGDKCLQTFSSLVSDVGTIEADAAQITGITVEQCQRFGHKRKTVLTMFLKAAEMADNIVCHNAQFDRNVLLRACKDAELPWWREDLPVLCTMKSATETLGLKGKYNKPKWPTLDETYKALVNPNGFTGAHDALADVNACWRVLIELRKRDIPLLRFSAQV